MYSLANNPILLPHQIRILKLFFASDFSKPFFLTGGTALSAFYFAHRESKDLDFFSLNAFEIGQLTATITDIAEKTQSVPTVKVASNTYREIYLENAKDGWIQRIDIVHDIPRHFGSLVTIDGVVVDALENIATNKILTLFGRLEPKDYVDFYVIMKKTDLKFEHLFELARQKDLGLFEFYFAQSIASVDTIESWPRLTIPLDIKELTAFYHDLSRKLLAKIKPKE